MLLSILKKLHRNLIRKPKIGDKVRVAVGFNYFLKEGIVSSINDEYCWIDQYTKSGEYIRSFTASLSYCKFYYL